MQEAIRLLEVQEKSEAAPDLKYTALSSDH
jgi:hypothetical protein